MDIGRAVKAIALGSALIFLLPVGSIEDRAVILTIFLISRIKRLQGRFDGDVFRCLLLSAVWIVWAWGNARARLGHGPFHVIDVSGVWRGYPFQYEEWHVVLNPHVQTWREFHLLGLAEDIAILVIPSVTVIRRFSKLRGNILSVLIAVLSGSFVWLNIEPWVDGVPIALRWPVPVRGLGVGYGYPFTYAGPLGYEWHARALVANIALGCVAWSILFAFSRFISRNGCAAQACESGRDVKSAIT